MYFTFIKHLFTIVLKTLWDLFCGVRVCIYNMYNAIPCYVHIIIVNLKIYAEPTYFPKSERSNDVTIRWPLLVQSRWWILNWSLINIHIDLFVSLKRTIIISKKCIMRRKNIPAFKWIIEAPRSYSFF